MTNPLHLVRTIGSPTPAGAFAMRMALFYALSSATIGLYWPFMPVLLEHRGMSPAMIGLMMSLPSFVRVLSTPAIAVLYDRSGDARRLVAGIGAVMVAAFLWLAVARSVPAHFVTIIVYALVGTAIVPITDTLAMRGVERYGLDYGLMRLWGSAAYIAMTFLGALAIEWYGATSLPPMLIGISLLVLGGSALLPAAATTHAEPTMAARQARFVDIGVLLTAPRFVTFLSVASLTQASHAVLYSFATLHWQARDIPAIHIGGLWGIGVVAEIALFAFGARPLRLLGARGLIALSAVAAVIRFGVMGFDPPLGVLYLLQAMHALTFGCTHLGAMYLINEAVPRRLAATAQGVYASATAGLIMGLSALSVGWLFGQFGVHSFWVMAGLAVAALWPAWALLRRPGPLLDEAPR